MQSIRNVKRLVPSAGGWQFTPIPRRVGALLPRTQVERLGEIGDVFSAIVYCEDAKCAYKIFYDESWKNPFLAQFLNKRIGTNTTLVLWVFNLIQTITDEEYMDIHQVRTLWQKAENAPIEETLVDGVIEFSSLRTRIYKGDVLQYVRFDCTDEKEGEVCYFFGVHETLLRKYFDDYSEKSREHGFCRFEVVGIGDDKFVLRIVDRETDELMAVLSSAHTNWMPRSEYDEAVAHNHVWSEDE